MDKNLELEYKLILRAKQGDKDAKLELYELYKNLILTVVNDYRMYGDKDDLLNEGLIGFFDALNRFDLSRNLKFSTFFVTYVRGRILDSIKLNSRKIAVPYNKISQIHRMSKLNADADSLNLSDADRLKYIKTNLNINDKDFEKLLETKKMMENILSMSDDFSTQIPSNDCTETAALNNTAIAVLHKGIKSLSSDEKKIIIEHFISQKPLTKVANEMNRPVSDIYSIKSLAMSKLKDYLHANGIDKTYIQLN